VSINATLIGQMVTFSLLVMFTMKYVWPPLLKALEERKKKIAEGLAAAEKGQHEMELAEKKATAILREAKEQAAEIVSLAQKRANEVMDESRQAAKAEGERLVATARTEIDREVEQAKTALRAQVATLAITAAEKILQKEIDQDKHKSMLGKLSKQLG
jgi:F-type H+-transporting ATPase subunit b